jgi:GNAT superfamily N-acetyltransferase
MYPVITFKQASDGDIPDILRLYAQPDMDNGKTISEDDAKELLLKLKQYPSYHFYIACQSNVDSDKDYQIVGVFGLLIMENIGHQGKPSGIVEGVCVAPHLQGQGIGKQMMMEAKSLCEAAGCYKIALTSNIKRKSAHGFYKSLGFIQHGISFQLVL